MIIIYISGIDGCGKTTQSTMLVKWLRDRGASAEYQWLRWEPSLRSIAGKLRRLASKKTDTSTQAVPAQQTALEDVGHSNWTDIKKRVFSNRIFRKIWLWYSSRDYFRSYQRARKAWGSDYVVMDRYLLDYVVDQSLNFSIHPALFLDKIKTTALAGMKKPTFSVFIDIPAETGYQRKLDGTPLEYLRQRESIYRDMPTDDRVLHVDGSRSPEEIHSEITRWLSERLELDNGN